MSVYECVCFMYCRSGPVPRREDAVLGSHATPSRTPICTCAITITRPSFNRDRFATSAG